MTDDFEVTTADMLEIVAGGGNGVEYVDIPGLLEKAAKELRDLTVKRDTAEAERDAMRADLAMLNSLRSQATKECDSLTAERHALHALLRYASGYLLVADAPVDDLLARIDAALKGGGDE